MRSFLKTVGIKAEAWAIYISLRSLIVLGSILAAIGFFFFVVGLFLLTADEWHIIKMLKKSKTVQVARRALREREAFHRAENNRLETLNPYFYNENYCA